MAVTTGTAKVTLPSDRQILITREFDAPRHLVYRAWTTPELVERWWAGQQGKLRIVEIDLRVGGRWRYVMDHDEGPEVAFHGVFRELVPNERIVNTEVYEMPGSGIGPEDEDGAALNIVTFVDIDGRTRLELLIETDSKEVRDLILESGMEVGMQQQMDLLDELTVTLRDAEG
jgi:uncharacterized protein YndB with AHSA1/START domain